MFAAVTAAAPAGHRRIQNTNCVSAAGSELGSRLGRTATRTAVFRWLMEKATQHYARGNAIEPASTSTLRTQRDSNPNVYIHRHHGTPPGPRDGCMAYCLNVKARHPEHLRVTMLAPIEDRLGEMLAKLVLNKCQGLPARGLFFLAEERGAPRTRFLTTLVAQKPSQRRFSTGKVAAIRAYASGPSV